MLVNMMLSIWPRLLIVALIIPSGFAEESGSLCIAPAIFSPKNTSSPGLFCEAEKFSLKIDAQGRAWPLKESVQLAGLDSSSRHRVIVLCDHKPQQSFTFRFSQFKTKQLCLFLNDGYRTVQLSESKSAPWCKCKSSK
jgi:hypothetical protein